MKILNFKLFTFITTLLFSFSIMSVALPEMPKLPGLGGGSNDSPAVDLPSAQANLETTMREALAKLNEAKQEYAKGLLPYAQGVALTAKVSDDAKSWIDAAQGELKSVRNPMKLNKLRKSLSGGMKIAKAIPDFLKTLGSSSKGVFSFARSQKMDTSDSEGKLPEDNFG